MTFVSMKKHYTGFYNYNNLRIQEKLGREQTFFELEISITNGDAFSGTVQEEIIGQPGTGIVKGRLKGDTISFVKQMSVAASILPEGQLKTYNTKHPKIHYRGKLENGTFSGSWKIKFGFIFVGFLPIPIPPISGNWEMREK